MLTNKNTLKVNFSIICWIIIFSMNLTDCLADPDTCDIKCSYLSKNNCKICYCSQRSIYDIKSCKNDLNINYDSLKREQLQKCVNDCCSQDYQSKLLTNQYLGSCLVSTSSNMTFIALGALGLLGICFFATIFIICKVCVKNETNELNICQQICNKIKKKFSGTRQKTNRRSRHISQLSLVDSIAPKYEFGDQVLIKNHIDCVICLEPKPNAVTSCNHFFHNQCLQQWIKNNQSCPSCRNKNLTPIKNYCEICCKKYIKIDGDKNVILKQLQVLFDRKCELCNINI